MSSHTKSFDLHREKYYQKSFLYGGKQIISLWEMSIYRLLIHRFAVPLPSQGKAYEETQLPAKPQFTQLCDRLEIRDRGRGVRQGYEGHISISDMSCMGMRRLSVSTTQLS